MNLFAQKQATVEDINSNPGKYTDESVQVTGFVEQFIPETASTTSHYIFKGSYGGRIKVTTEDKPQINQEYTITGIVYIEATSQRPFISERRRSIIGGPKKPEDLIRDPEPPKNNGTLIVIVILASVVIIGLIAYIASTKNKAPAQGSAPSVGGGSTSTGGGDPAKAVPTNDAPTIVQPVAKELSTIKIDPVPKTMKFIPGQLTIVNGPDSGKAFKIAGYPTAEGNVVTIGREKVTGPKAFSHIHLNDPNNTVSRKQARIIERGGQIILENSSEVNYTDVDGTAYGPKETVQLKNGSHIRMGYIELKYTK